MLLKSVHRPFFSTRAAKRRDTMAWLSVGANNEDLCEKLLDHAVLKGEGIIRAFKLTDRGDFVFQSFRHEAYYDRPFKRGFIHISAPHMYVTVLEALDLSPGQAFLNVGSGSGYLTCLAASLLGEGGVSHGVDINPEVVAHSIECCNRYFSNLLTNRSAGDNNLPPISPEGVQIVAGDCFQINKILSHCCRYDRIYIGAACPQAKIEYFYDFLADDGILVVPVEETNELIKIHRVKGSVVTKSTISHVHFASLIQTDSSLKVSLPRVFWTPSASRHKQFPPAFRTAIKTILFARPNFNSGQPLSFVHNLPHHLWAEIFKFCTRDWFVPCRSPLEQALEELVEERRLRIAAEENLRRSEALQLAAERERDIYRLIVERMRNKISASGAQRNLVTQSVALPSFALSWDEEDEDHDSGSESESENLSTSDEGVSSEFEDNSDDSNEVQEEGEDANDNTTTSDIELESSQNDAMIERTIEAI